MPQCSAFACKNRGTHIFPKDPKRRKLWENALRIKNFKASNSSRLCADHFKEEDYFGQSIYTNYAPFAKFLRKSAVPSIFSFTKKKPVLAAAIERECRVESRDQRKLLLEQGLSGLQPMTSVFLKNELLEEEEISVQSPIEMSKRTVTNPEYKGLVENMSIPVELHARPGGAPYASFGAIRPIHCCTPEEISQYAETTHHFCDIFTEQMLAPLGELAYVRIDENTAEKVFINRAKRILLLSSDGRLAQWRAAYSFESANKYVAGAPLVTKDGELLSIVTARKGNHYAVSSFEGDGGYFDTSEPWTTIEIPEGHLIYGDRTFPSREELRAYVASLPPLSSGPAGPARPILHHRKSGSGDGARIALVAPSGRQISHIMLHNLTVAGVEYL